MVNAYERKVAKLLAVIFTFGLSFDRERKKVITIYRFERWKTLIFLKQFWKYLCIPFRFMRISGRFIVHYFPVKWILKHKPVTLSLSHSECKTKFKLNDAERMNKSLPNTNRNHLWILQIAISKVKRMKLWMLDSNVRNETFLVQKLWIKRGKRRDDWDSDIAHVVYVSPFNQNISGKRKIIFDFHWIINQRWSTHFHCLFPVHFIIRSIIMRNPLCSYMINDYTPEIIPLSYFINFNDELP